MQIGIVGKGNIGRTIGSKWEQAGHAVVYGVREIKAAAPPSYRPIGETIQNAEVVLFAIPGPTMESIINQHATQMRGKILIDATNNIRGAQMSGVPMLADQVPDAQVYRAFNSLGWEVFAEPRFGDERADLFYCGSDDPQATAAVELLIEQVGLRPVRVGGLDQLEVVDTLVRLWLSLATAQGWGRHMAFKVLSERQ